MKKAQRVVGKVRKSKAKRNMDTFFLQVKNTGIITPTQGVAVSNYVYNAWSLDPTAPSSGMSHLTNTEFILYQSMYDKYRINSVTVTVTPKANVFDAGQAQNDAAYTLTGDGMVHTCIDRDGIAPSNIYAISRYPSYRKFSALKKFSRKYAIRYPTGVWIDCQTPGTFPAPKELGLTGGITIYAENLIEDKGELYNEPWAEVHVAYDIVFQGKTMNKLSAVRDEDGKLVSVTLEPYAPEDNLEQSLVRAIRGTEHDEVLAADAFDEPPAVAKVST